MIRDFLVLAVSGLVGNWAAEKWILKSSPDDPTGFVLVSDGLGMDDAARAITIAVVAMIANKVIPG